MQVHASYHASIMQCYVCKYMQVTRHTSTCNDTCKYMQVHANFHAIISCIHASTLTYMQRYMQVSLQATIAAVHASTCSGHASLAQHASTDASGTCIVHASTCKLNASTSSCKSLFASDEATCFHASTFKSNASTFKYSWQDYLHHTLFHAPNG